MKAAYKDGSLPPIARIVYPKENRQNSDAPDPPGYPVFRTPAVTSASSLPLTANGYDQDGSLEKLFFVADGQTIPLQTGYLQLLDQPEHGETFSLSDGLGVTVLFRFDSNGGFSDDPVSVSKD